MQGPTEGISERTVPSLVKEQLTSGGLVNMLDRCNQRGGLQART